ncbi:hypothetical protein OIU85_019186 [Salix viminalis]|uniref:Uncharacterized protein n=1 Tax=Salix viminalis TaxID=40686 RepID=A0A9Q0UW03_SALVM|nr:hypothetical protein OIU85_019186 [Salix viminalis]
MQSNIQEHQEISQASEICSNITDTLSTATATTTTTTTTITEIREDEATSRKRVNRSPAKVHRKRPYNGDRERVLRYPAKTTGQVIRTAAGQPSVGSRGGRSDFGRSPATRTAAIGVGRGRAGTKPGKVTGKGRWQVSGEEEHGGFGKRLRFRGSSRRGTSLSRTLLSPWNASSFFRSISLFIFSFYILHVSLCMYIKQQTVTLCPFHSDPFRSLL